MPIYRKNKQNQNSTRSAPWIIEVNGDPYMPRLCWHITKIIKFLLIPKAKFLKKQKPFP